MPNAIMQQPTSQQTAAPRRLNRRKVRKAKRLDHSGEKSKLLWCFIIGGLIIGAVVVVSLNFTRDHQVGIKGRSDQILGAWRAEQPTLPFDKTNNKIYNVNTWEIRSIEEQSGGARVVVWVKSSANNGTPVERNWIMKWVDHGADGWVCVDIEKTN